MNARTEVFELTLEGQQVDEALACLFHTVLFHRTIGKLTYEDHGNSYAIGTLGYEDRDCNYIDLTYVCCSSRALDQTLKREISSFSEQLRASQGNGMGHISLEFFQKKPPRWMFAQERIPWEIWTVYLNLIPLNSMGERQIFKERLGEVLVDKIFHITEVVNRHEYVPQMPVKTGIDQVFDTSYTDIQPYLFNLNYSVSGPSSGISMGTTVKKFIRDTLSL